MPGSLTTRRGHRSAPQRTAQRLCCRQRGSRRGTPAAGGSHNSDRLGTTGVPQVSNPRPLEGGLGGSGTWAGGSPSPGTLRYRNTQLPFVLQAEHTQAGGGALEVLLLQ